MSTGWLRTRGRLNYELWQWWMNARDVSAKFVEFLDS